jgi:hypothetical protein
VSFDELEIAGGVVEFAVWPVTVISPATATTAGGAPLLG